VRAAAEQGNEADEAWQTSELRSLSNGQWDVYFSCVRLGRLDERRMRIEDPYGRWSRWDALPMSPMLSPMSPSEQ